MPLSWRFLSDLRTWKYPDIFLASWSTHTSTYTFWTFFLSLLFPAWFPGEPLYRAHFLSFLSLIFNCFHTLSRCIMIHDFSWFSRISDGPFSWRCLSFSIPEQHWLCLNSALVGFLGQLRCGEFSDDIGRSILVGFGFHFSGGKATMQWTFFWLRFVTYLRFAIWRLASSQDQKSRHFSDWILLGLTRSI